MYLAMRRASNSGAATVREIFNALKGGGFAFQAKEDANAQRGLRKSLTKNSATFHKLPVGTAEQHHATVLMSLNQAVWNVGAVPNKLHFPAGRPLKLTYARNIEVFGMKFRG